MFIETKVSAQEKINEKSQTMNRSLSCPTFLSYILCFFCSSDYAQSITQNLENENDSVPYDVIIVPGVPYTDPTFAIILKARLLWSKYLFENKIAKNIIYSGSSVYTPFVEGKIMRIYADSLQIPSEHTFSETQAEHSTENIYYSLLMAKELGFKKVGVATDQYQTLLIARYIKKNCPEVTIIPIEYKKIHLMKTPWPEINPNSAYVNDFVSIVERETRIKRLKGTMGMNINYARKDSVEYASKSPMLVGIGKLLNPGLASSPNVR